MKNLQKQNENLLSLVNRLQKELRKSSDSNLKLIRMVEVYKEKSSIEPEDIREALSGLSSIKEEVESQKELSMI